MDQKFDALVMITPKDYIRLQNNYHRLVECMPARRLLFIGSKAVGELVDKADMGERVYFLDEEEILSFSEVHGVMSDQMKDILSGDELPRGITGWYYQQFLKMQYAYLCKDKYYLVWDGDTIPCKVFSMFHERKNTPYFDMKMEYHQEYFATLSKLLPGMQKCIEKSFISEHMLIDCGIMRKLIKDIQGNSGIPGDTFWEKIIRSIEAGRIQECSFSEFETYGTYTCMRYPTEYRLRNWHSFRQGGEFFDPNKITNEDYEWLGRDFDAISFEKGHFVREDHRNLFDNKKYQQKLSARKMLEIAQQEFKEGYLESWESI